MTAETLGSAAPSGNDPLGGLFDPASVAVVGASADPRKWGHWIARGALEGRDRREVFLVNRSGATVLDTPTIPRLSDLTSPPELVVVAAPGAQVPSIVEEGLAGGSRYVVVITAAVGDPPTAAAESQLAALVRRSGARLLGPNCMGLVDTTTSLSLSWGAFPSGSVGLVSQSGNVALELARMLGRAGLGFSRVISLGNQRDIDAADAVESLVHHEPTHLIAAYVEDFRDGRRVGRVLGAARAAGKPVLLLTVGGSEASARAAQSHTGALVSPIDVVEAVCAHSGAIRVASTGELVDAAQLLLARTPTAGHRVAVVADSGGQAALAADALEATGIEVPPLSGEARSALAGLLPPYAGIANPVDLAGAGEADLENYARVATSLVGSGTDVTLLTGYFGDYGHDSPELVESEVRAAELLAGAARETGRSVLVHSMARDTRTLRRLRALGVPVYERIEQAAQALSHSQRWQLVEPHREVPGIPPPAPPIADLGYEALRSQLVALGIGFPEATFVDSAGDVLRVAHSVGYPVALKAMGILHKTEAGGVRLGLEGDRELRAAFSEMQERTGAARYAVEHMVASGPGVELIMGVRHDPAFGPVAMVGMGGTAAELLADSVVGIAPLDEASAGRMIRGLRQTPLLTGWRSTPALDVEAACRVLTTLAGFGASHPELAELELNPVRVSVRGAVALDVAATAAADTA